MATATSLAGQLTGPRLSVETCARRLALQGAPCAPRATVAAEISWAGPSLFPPERRWSEATIQALCGLMEVHGWDAGRPRRLGLEVASVAAGMLAAQGVLAARIGDLRGHPVSRIETSVLTGGLWLVAHHIAAATAGGEPLPSPPGPEPGPPFATADGRWFEIEVFDPEAWKSFWQALGAGDADLGRAWTAFRARYYRGRCSLPPGLRRAAAAHPLARVAEVAAACQVSLSPVRAYAEVLEHPGWSCDRPSIGEAVGEASPSQAPPDRGPALPLTGLRVVEATSRMQGPLAALLLQMLGADVVRVEPPGGDPGRMVPPVAGDTSSFFLCYNRGKRAAQIDLTGRRGRAELLDLLAGSDVFLQNWRPGKAAEWGLDRGDVNRAAPHLVYAEATGWDPVAENARLIGTDFLVQAFCGFGDGLNPVGEAPLTSRALLSDCMGAVVTSEGILTGLYLREVTGRPVPVRSSLLQGALAAQAHVLEPMAAGRDGQGRRGGRPLWGPLDVPLEAQAGSLVVTAEGDPDMARLAEACGVASGARPPAEVGRLVAERLRDRPAHEWEERLAGAGLPCAAVSTDLAALPDDPRLAPMFEPLGGTAKGPASPWTLRP